MGATSMPNAKVALIVCCKWEERYIAEFLEHYRDVVKVDKVFLADNNDVGYSPDIREVIAPFMREGFVEYCDYRDVEDVQHACYSEIFFRIKDDFDLDVWDFLQDFGKIGKQQKDLIYLFMEQRGIREDGTCWDTIAKIYQRLRNIYLTKNRKKNHPT